MTTLPDWIIDVNLLDKITEGRALPDGFDAWAIRTVRPDFTSQHGYRYPFPGNVAEAPGPILDHAGECPGQTGDGVCAALTWRGMASGGVTARTLLLVAYAAVDVLGRSSDKLRLRRMFVVDLIDGERLVREQGAGTDLSGADLSRAYLHGADLHGAYLSGADLSGAYLSRANLSGADLHGAYLSGADLHGAYLSGADLSGANLSRADLSRANLSRAYLSGADLSGANLSRADLSRADLTGTDLTGTDLTGTDLRGANLTGANLSRANLSGADLYRADLSGARNIPEGATA